MGCFIVKQLEPRHLGFNNRSGVRFGPILVPFVLRRVRQKYYGLGKNKVCE